MSALTDYFSKLAAAIRAKTGKSTQLSPTDMVDEVDAVYQKGYDDATPVTQTKTANAMPATSDRTISPDSGKLLSGVIIPAAYDGNLRKYLDNNKVTDTGAGAGNFTITFPSTGIYLIASAIRNVSYPGSETLTGCEYITKGPSTLHTSVTSSGTTADNYSWFFVVKVNQANASITNLRLCGYAPGATATYLKVKLCDL